MVFDGSRNNSKKSEYTKEYLRTLKSCAETIEKEVIKNGLTIEEFNSLRVISSDLLSPEQSDTMKKIRESVPSPTEETIMQKAITEDVFEEYLDSISTVRGFISRAQDTIDSVTFMDYIKVLRLDYCKSKFIQYVDEKDGCMYLIRFRSLDIDEVKIPFGKNLGGNNTYEMPCTGNGFTSADENHIVPEYLLENNIGIDEAEIYEITQDGKEILKAIFDEKLDKFILVE